MGDVLSFTHEGEFIAAGERTDQDWIDAGKVIARKEVMTNREKGEWFNGVKGSRGRPQKGDLGSPLSTKEICKLAGIDHGHAKVCGRVVTAFPTVESQGGLSWTVCRSLLPAYTLWVVNVGAKKAAENMGRLISDAAAGKQFMSDFDPGYQYRGPWSVADAVRQVAFITGKEVRVENKQADNSKKVIIGAVEKAVESLPKKKAAAILKAVSAEVARETKKLQDTFSDAVNAAVTERLKDVLDPMIAEHRERIEQAKSSQQIANNRLKGVPALMTRAEFKLVLNCLHPDRAPADRRAKFGEAFATIKRLEEDDDDKYLEEFAKNMKPATSSFGEILRNNIQEQIEANKLAENHDSGKADKPEAE